MLITSSGPKQSWKQVADGTALHRVPDLALGPREDIVLRTALSSRTQLKKVMHEGALGGMLYSGLTPRSAAARAGYKDDEQEYEEPFPDELEKLDEGEEALENGDIHVGMEDEDDLDA